MEFKEKTLKSKTIYEGKVVTLLKDDIVTSDGYESIREVVKHSGGVVILAVKDGKIVMVRQYRYPAQEVLLELPAGKLEYGEEPFPAAKRELEEETGYIAEKWTDMGFVYTSPGYSDEKLHLYKAENLQFVGCHPDNGEVIEPLEFDKERVFEMVKTGEIRDAKTLCAILKGKIL